MHLGNIFAALISRLAIKSIGGEWVLRIEDLDPQRSRYEYARMIEDDLHWLGLDWDEGGVDSQLPHGPYMQSQRSDFYEKWLAHPDIQRLTYHCVCRRADILATQAPHQSDGRIVYAGTCRPIGLGGTFNPAPGGCRRGALRICVPDDEIHFTDIVCGEHVVKLSEHCGDFILRRADGAWAYQFAVVVDDALMGITQVVRGNDLLLSSAQQIFLYRTLGFGTPQFAHVPLMCNEAGQRLSKRDRSLAMDTLRQKYSPRRVLGMIAHLAGLLDEPEECSFDDLLSQFSFQPLMNREKILLPNIL